MEGKINLLLGLSSQYRWIFAFCLRVDLRLSSHRPLELSMKITSHVASFTKMEARGYPIG